MRNQPNVKLEKYRNHRDPNSSICAGTNAGSFFVPQKNGSTLVLVVSDGGGWDHVSVSFGRTSTRCPTWEEMCFVKELCFRDNEAVMQLHPAKDKNISFHPYTLHLWRPQTQEERDAIEEYAGEKLPVNQWPTPGPIPLPAPIMVGPPRDSELETALLQLLGGEA